LIFMFCAFSEEVCFGLGVEALTALDVSAATVAIIRLASASAMNGNLLFTDVAMVSRFITHVTSVAALHDSHPAVHGECVTDDVAGCRTAKKQHGGGDLVWRASASDGDVLGNLGVRLFVAADHIASNLRVDQSGIDGIHADAVLDVFQSRRPCQTDDSMLGGDI